MSKQSRIYFDGESPETPIAEARQALVVLGKAGFQASVAQVIQLPEGRVVCDLLDPEQAATGGAGSSGAET